MCLFKALHVAFKHGWSIIIRAVIHQFQTRDMTQPHHSLFGFGGKCAQKVHGLRCAALFITLSRENINLFFLPMSAKFCFVVHAFEHSQAWCKWVLIRQRCTDNFLWRYVNILIIALKKLILRLFLPNKHILYKNKQIEFKYLQDVYQIALGLLPPLLPFHLIIQTRKSLFSPSIHFLPPSKGRSQWHQAKEGILDLPSWLYFPAPSGGVLRGPQARWDI